MSATSHEAAWRSAQVAELRYHMQLMDPPLERHLHNGIAGLLRLMVQETANLTVLDVAAGPLSLLLDYPARRATALDPLDFGSYETAYEQASIERVRTRAEEYAPGRQWDEVWMYNCLQHVWRPAIVLAHITHWARSRIRVFEWVEQPTSVVHLHTLHREEIAGVLWGNGWQPAYELSGVWRERSVNQQFYAAHWVPLAVPL